jgi:phosphoribosylformylglycinamidine synthase PurS subunit
VNPFNPKNPGRDKMQYHVYIATERKEAILDPQGKAAHHALDSLGLSQVEDVRIGKFIRLAVDADSEGNAKAIAEESGKKLLANPIMETFRVIEIKEAMSSR